MKQFVEKKPPHIKDCDCSQCRIASLEKRVADLETGVEGEDSVMFHVEHAHQRLDTLDDRLAKEFKKVYDLLDTLNTEMGFSNLGVQK